MESGGRCGPCGDPWFSPKANEAGGKFATGTIARYYATGQIINVTVEKFNLIFVSGMGVGTYPLP
jgi:hypothetical protein